MPTIRILTEDELRALVPLDLAAIDCVENAFASLVGRPVVMPPVTSVPVAEARGEVDIRTAYIPGLPRIAVKVSPEFSENDGSGLLLMLSATTGQAEALLLDNGYLTDVRTAAAGAVAARALSLPTAERVAILGAGVQARMQLRALNFVRPLSSVMIWARDLEKARDAAEELGRDLGFRVEAVGDAEEAVAEAQIIVTTTASTRPVLMAEWLRPGQHVTAIGSDRPGKNELEPACLTRGRYVPDLLEQTRVLGELRAAIEAGVVEADAEFVELGAIVAGKAPKRTGDDEITIADLTGTAVQDTAIATWAAERADAAGAGTTFEG